jgi:hypothetical protein
MRSKPFFIALTFFPLVLAGPALAGDGVVEISQTCVSTGCFSGDEPGYPITIDGSAGASYKLTSNLSRTPPLLGGTLSHTIEVTAPGISIDLNGFRIRCTNLLGGSCPDQGDGGGSGGVGDGIHGVQGLAVSNGTIQGLPDDGIDAGRNSQVRNVRVIGNRDVGVELDQEAQILDSVAGDNGGAGFRISVSGLVSRCTSNGNEVGVVAGLGTSVLESTIYNNSSAGILGLGTFAYGLTTLQSNSPNIQGSARQIAVNSCDGSSCP